MNPRDKQRIYEMSSEEERAMFISNVNNHTTAVNVNFGDPLRSLSDPLEFQGFQPNIGDVSNV